MATLSSKLKYGYWFFRKGYFSQLIFMLKNRDRSNSAEKALIWCKSKVLSEQELFSILNIGRHSIKNDFPDYLKEGKSKMNSCPYKMEVGPNPDILYSLVKELQPRYIIETGVAYGWSSLAILLGIQDNENSHLWSTDMPYPNLGNEDYVGCAVNKDLRGKWTLIRKPDVMALPIALNECGLIDFFHYDSDSSYAGQMNAAELVWPNLKMGGIYIYSNIHKNQAFKDFCQKINREPIVFKSGSNYFGLIRK